MDNTIAQGKAINPVKSKSYDKTENGTPIIMPGQENDKNMFFKLLSAQMSNPDPMNQQDPTQYVTQLAQFTILDEMMSVNDGMEYLIGMQNGLLVNSALSTATSLIGKNVEVYAPIEDGDEVGDTPKTHTGNVEGVHIKDGVVYLDMKLDETGEIKSFEYGSLKKINEKNTNLEEKGE
ncbi:flagellar hook assembly protein FlgD [[Clostridium] dakarense]|uniref:flagellar hook assembly protein FlgD n=1 Tax=Faecalimicrobium dakarense TaxID=1301100 RepID=UPI0004B58C3D|nr:flagellar hook capping FlgD N-terminal domain-containing protein [[Clostridium] dakarense]